MKKSEEETVRKYLKTLDLAYPGKFPESRIEGALSLLRIKSFPRGVNEVLALMERFISGAKSNSSKHEFFEKDLRELIRYIEEISPKIELARKKMNAAYPEHRVTAKCATCKNDTWLLLKSNGKHPNYGTYGTEWAFGCPDCEDGRNHARSAAVYGDHLLRFIIPETLPDTLRPIAVFDTESPQEIPSYETETQEVQEVGVNASFESGMPNWDEHDPGPEEPLGYVPEPRD